MKFRIIILIVLPLFVTGFDMDPSPDYSLAGNNVGEIIENTRNCDVINSILLSPWAKDFYIHGWESIGTKKEGYILFIAGFEQYPKQEWLVLAWEVKNNKANYLADANSAVTYLRSLMEKEKDSYGPAGPMEHYQKWNMCKLKNMDYYHGKTFSLSALFNMKESMAGWSKSVNLPYRNMVDYIQEAAKSKPLTIYKIKE